MILKTLVAILLRFGKCPEVDMFLCSNLLCAFEINDHFLSIVVLNQLHRS